MPSFARRCLLPMVCFLAALAHTAEPWADARLPEALRDGLLIWLDATQQNAARKSMLQPEFAHDAALAAWYDASGHKRHLKQNKVTQQPRLQLHPGGAAVRFDGSDDFLAADGLGLSAGAATIVIVGAPFSHLGGFRGFLATSAAGKNDFQTGITVDLGPEPSAQLQFINVEGAGFGGAADLFSKQAQFGTLQRLVVTAAPGKGGTRLFVNGELAGARDHGDAPIQADRVTLGARSYKLGGAPEIQGFLDGDIFEVLIFDRVLPDKSLAALNSYLVEKYKDVKITPPASLAAPDGRLLQPLTNPPPIQMFVPGFKVVQLPLELKNVNNVLYRHDGKLVALTYSGDVYLLSDSDGDGLEDKADLFWDNKGRIDGPIGMDVTPKGYAKGNGVLVAARGKCVLLLDNNSDDKADEELIVGKGWPAITHRLDALGIAMDRRDGSVYLGLGTSNFTNGYLLDAAGNAGYALNSERGTILKVSPDFTKREIVCTGIRFPVAIRFNASNDLFCTDQEGATWLANGNPLDELLHIETGRHYGFPPRHPTHLNNVIDEPSVFDYGPQHQSVCGLNFNEPVNGGPVFGPELWRGDALISAYSRGKLYRTKLHKTAAGYVAQSQLLASLDKLTVDACVSPAGELVVATHSGSPDWGSGPNGMGTLYKIQFSEKAAPQPVAVWAAGPGEVAIAFDRPLELEQLRQLSTLKEIEYGRHVSAGDRFEKFWPGYQVVQQQRATPRFPLAVFTAGSSADRRTVLLQTATHKFQGGHALTLPSWGRPAQTAAGEQRQEPVSDLRYDLSGLEAQWRAAVGGREETLWLPHADLAVAKTFTQQSAPHEQFWPLLELPGTLTLRSKLNLWQMLRPAVQPGSAVDFQLPDEQVSLVVSGPLEFSVTLAGAKLEESRTATAKTITATVTMAKNEWVPLEITLPTGKEFRSATLHYFTAEDSRPRALQLHRFILPWAKRENAAPQIDQPQTLPPELAGGDWQRGRAVFFGDQAQCSRCHTLNSRGGHIGPDLSNLIHRDITSVLRDIRQPSAAINPDHVAYVVKLTDGRVLTGIPRDAGDGKMVIGDSTGQEITVARDAIKSTVAQAISLMPEGLEQAIGPEKFRDLVAFLVLSPLQAAPLEIKHGVPPPRTHAEVRKTIGAVQPGEKTAQPLNIVLVSGKKDHGPGEHDYPLWKKRWAVLLGLADGVQVSTADEWPSAEQLQQANVLVFYQRGAWSAERAAAIDAFMKRGGGTVYLHFAVDGGSDPTGFSDHIGLAWKGGVSKFRHGELDLKIHDREHPVFRGFPESMKFTDESYWKLVGDPQKIKTLASGVEDGAAQPLAWTYERDGGRVFVTILGHYSWTFDDPFFRLMVLRAICWSARQPADRLSELSLIGARVQD